MVLSTEEGGFHVVPSTGVMPSLDSLFTKLAFPYAVKCEAVTDSGAEVIAAQAKSLILLINHSRQGSETAAIPCVKRPQAKFAHMVDVKVL